MKTLNIVVLAVVLFFVFISAEVLKAQDFSRKNGIGLLAGEPTGLTYKRWLGQSSAFDVGVAWSVSSDANVSVHTDYLFHQPNKFTITQKNTPLSFYYGGGLRLRLGDDDTEFGIRVPVGTAYYFDNKSIELFAEIVPLIDLAPDTEFEMNGGIGIRYYF